MERLWDSEVSMMYPKKWVVMVNCAWEGNKNYGEIHLVTDDKKEAYAVAKKLGDDFGVIGVVEGFDDTPRIGGLRVCDIQS
jgi:hypothetical protein